MATLDAVKKELRLSKWAVVKDTVLKAHSQSRNLQRTILGIIPQAEEQVRNISNRVAVGKEVLKKIRYLMVGRQFS